MGKISTLLIGGAIGAAAALLYAPRKGEETRALVSEKVNAVWGEAKDWTAGAPAQAQSAYQSAQVRGEAVLRDVTAKGQELASAAKAQASEFAQVASEKGHEVASFVQDAVTASPAADDELRAKIEAARQRIAAQVVKNAEESSDTVEVKPEVEAPAEDASTQDKQD
ncbi:YtxH domain-containing protein [Berryella wangjianweii]|uniref:YtxH domain-containing protein n=1 Tax=Berryella wangjianweii TaxID=2734634 RepID=A0A6M8J1P5_9ACTN|nr:YtxH domain-containing protein [Berryella wangjianweii]NPD31944.1 YtxH domain-containing protein [Eggerthellaceae bacterium zg-997]QKF07464.1 YtxH domain-containing protein [Berryella wangjianweii]